MATPSPARSPGDLATFNILHGFPEALVRGMRSSFLADADYHHLTQCETLDDARLNLSETDYHDALADTSSMTPASMQKLAIEKVRVSMIDGAGYFLEFFFIPEKRFSLMISLPSNNVRVTFCFYRVAFVPCFPAALVASLLRSSSTCERRQWSLCPSSWTSSRTSI
jgi:hypothetical protein